MANRFLTSIGQGLPEAQAANALAAAVCSRRWPAPLLSPAGPRGRIEGSGRLLPDVLRAPRLQAEELARSWVAHARSSQAPPPPVRPGLAIDVELSPQWAADAPALLDALRCADGVVSAVLVTAPARAPAEWLWPLDVALLAEPVSERLRLVVNGLRWSRFVRPIEAGKATSPIELLVLPRPLPHALRLLLAPHAFPRVQTVLVLGGPGDRSTCLANAEALRAAARADGICVAPVAEDGWAAFLDETLYHLSHDLDLDVAVARACDARKSPPPFLVGCSGAFARAHISRWATAVGRRLSRAAPPATAAARAPAPPPMPGAAAGPQVSPTAGLLDRLPNLRWDSETHDATEAAGAGDLAKEARPRARSSDRRLVQLALHDEEDASREPLTIGPLLRDHSYSLDLWIGPRLSGSLAADAPFPDEDLPDEEQHELTVVLAAPAARQQVQLRRLALPRHGASDPVRFELSVVERVQHLEARISILHENRVVQTLRLEAGVGEGAPRELSFLVEAVLRDLDGLTGRPAFDAALLFNDLGGAPTLSVFAGDRASLVDSSDVDAKLAVLMKTLSDATNRPGRYGPPDTRASTALLGALARQGSLLRQSLMRLPGVRDELAAARRIQILSARPERVLPIELCYDPPFPSEEAEMCPSWKGALGPARPDDEERADIVSCGAPCPADRSKVVCPIGFWATSRVIERHAYRKQDARKLGAADFALQTERPDGRAVLQILSGSLCAAAKQARAEKPGLVNEAFAAIALASASSKEVKDWDAWKQEVAARSPGLLVLLAHTEPRNDIAALVIGDEERALLGEIDERFVRRSDGPPPLVMLLGCSTASTERPFQSFVVQFQNVGGAAIVLGTLCEILGQHAAPIAQALTARLKAASGLPLGNLMLDARRALLAQGFPIVLSVVAFGDADWRV